MDKSMPGSVSKTENKGMTAVLLVIKEVIVQE